MKFSVLAFVFLAISSPLSVLGQTDDVRSATGLPIPIGVPVIYGQVTIRGLEPGEKKPFINVSLIVRGVIADRVQTNDKGYYFFLRSPGDGTTLVFEVNSSEVGRVVLSAGTVSSTRRDVELDWKSVAHPSLSSPSVISVRSAYDRTPQAGKLFEQAMNASKSKHKEGAVGLFKQIVEADAKDFVAWTELGTLYFTDAKYDDAAAAYNRALALKPDFAAALMNLGKLYLSQKEFDKAIATFLKAATADPASSDAFHYLGESYLQAKQGSKAVVALNEAIRLAPIANAEIHLRLATLYNAAGARDRAAAEYSVFLKKVPDYPNKEKLEKYIKENGK